MISNKHSRKTDIAIPSGSMADIAFLLLLFFIVVSKVDVEMGIAVKLPKWIADPKPTILPEREILMVNLNASEEMLIRGKPSKLNDLKETAILFIGNMGQLDKYSTDPKKAIVVLKGSRAMRYDFYFQVYNEINAAYKELRDEYALDQFGYTLAELKTTDPEKVKSVIDRFPIRLSEEFSEELEYNE